MALAGITKSKRAFAIFAWAVLFFNIPVILWGAYVRVSFSGDGCGAHWPFCNGQVLPQNMTTPTVIEFTHRMMTSMDSFAVIALCVWAFYLFPKRHSVRFYSVLSLVFLFIEALLGAGLVLFRKVARDQSAGRVWYLSAHLTNTMLLLAAFTVTAWLASEAVRRTSQDSDSPSGIRLGELPTLYWGALLTTILVSITGVVAALGDMLFPASSLSAGVSADFSSQSSTLLRLRAFHPVIALIGAVYLVSIAVGVLKREHETRAGTAATRVLTLTVFQIAAGFVNLTLLAPIWMQLIHLLIADLLWIAVVVLALEVTGAIRTSEQTQAPRSMVAEFN